MALLDPILLGLVALTVLLWLLAPLIVRLTFRHDAAPTLEPWDRWEVPDRVAEFLEPRVEDLEALGFEDCGWASCEATPGGALWFALLRNDSDQNMACVSAAMLRGAAGAERLHLGQVEFATVWPDGREILTTNLAQPLAIDPLPEHDFLQVPHEEDLAALLRIHEARVADRAWGSATNPAPGREIESVERLFRRVLRYHEERGWFWRRESEAGSEYRLTLRGAWRMTTRLLFPYAQLARRRIRRRCERVLAALAPNPR